MASFTNFLKLLKKNPATDGKDTFNIETMLNENWDKIDQKVEENSSAIGQIATQKGHTKTITKSGTDIIVTDRLGGNILTVETISKSGNIVTSVLKDSTGKIIETRTVSKAIDGITEEVV